MNTSSHVREQIKTNTERANHAIAQSAYTEALDNHRELIGKRNAVAQRLQALQEEYKDLNAQIENSFRTCTENKLVLDEAAKAANTLPPRPHSTAAIASTPSLLSGSASK